jgi:RHS repeat-associated protein
MRYVALPSENSSCSLRTLRKPLEEKRLFLWRRLGGNPGLVRQSTMPLTGSEFVNLVANSPQASYYRARYYDPQSGRFLTEDSLGFKGNGPDFYKYTLNDPTDLTDPLGLNAQPVPLPWRGPVLVPDPGRGIPFPWLPIGSGDHCGNYLARSH